MAEQSRGRRRQRAVVCCGRCGRRRSSSVSPAAAHAAPSEATAPTCTVNFTSSEVNPTVGENITLSWSASGADELVASWTTAHVPFSGSQVTTKDIPGPASYQVTGLKSGQYCGGAVVNVVFAAASGGAPSSSSPAPTSSTVPSTSASSVARRVQRRAATVTSPSATYPAQSPTGGASTPWYERPVSLLVLGVLSLFGSLALFNRERVRALLVRRH